MSLHRSYREKNPCEKYISIKNKIIHNEFFLAIHKNQILQASLLVVYIGSVHALIFV